MKGGFRIGEWFVQPELNSIAGPGGVVHVEPKVMQVLLFLARRAGEVAHRERLIEAVWADTFVTDDVLTRCISVLRHVFHDDPRAPRIIQTIPKIGYRLIAQVAFLDEEADQPLSLAVLPFSLVSADAEIEQLMEAVEEGIINCLAGNPGLRVAARSTVGRDRRRLLDPRAAGRELGASAVLMGSAVRFGEKLMILTELVEVESGWRLWGTQFYPRTADRAGLVEEISRTVCEGLVEKLHAREARSVAEGGLFQRASLPVAAAAARLASTL